MPSWSWKPGRHLWNDHPFTSDFFKANSWEVFDPPNDAILIVPISLLGFSILSQELSGSFHVVVSGSPAVCLHLFPLSPNSFVSQSPNSFVSQSGSWCLQMSPNSFVSQPGWCCPALQMSLFTCLTSCISQSGLWCPALWTFIVTCLPLFVVRCLCSLVSLHLSPSVARGVRLPIFLWTYFPSFVFQCAYTSVRLFGCLSSLVSLHLSPLVVIGCPALWMSFSISSVLQCA
jgi:hypothetical protein